MSCSLFFFLTLELFRQVLFDIPTIFSNFTASPVRDPNLTDPIISRFHVAGEMPEMYHSVAVGLV